MPKRLLLSTLFTLALGAALCAQTRYHELGLRSGGLNNFDFIYKRSTDQRKFLRLRLLALNTEIQLRDSNDRDNYNAGGAIGFEVRKAVADEFYFIHGPELFLSAYKSETRDRQLWSAGARLGYLLGFNYIASDRFVFGLEIIPGLEYRFGEDALGLREESLNLNLSSSAVALTAVYRFSTAKD